MGGRTQGEDRFRFPSTFRFSWPRQPQQFWLVPVNRLGLPLPVGIRLWDGSTAGPEDGPAFVLRDREALRRLLWRPGELGLARAWVAGDLEVDGDLYELLKRISTLLWERDEPGSRTAALRGALSVLTTPGSLRTVSRTLGLAGIGLPPAPRAEELVAAFSLRSLHWCFRSRTVVLTPPR